MPEKETQKAKTFFVEKLDSPRIYVFGTKVNSTLRLHYDQGDFFVILDDDTEKRADETAKV